MADVGGNLEAICFVIQPFNSKFNKRFDDVFLPAITGAGLKPYRVDRDHGAAIPIETIERQIKQCNLCFCDISEDNPNVWFELGFAIAAGKDVCLVRERNSQKALPFDVQHRRVIFYDAESPSDFEKFRVEATSRLLAMKKAIAKEETIQAIVSEKITDAEGDLGERDRACMALFGANQSGPEGDLSFYEIKQFMERAGYNQLAAQLSIRQLLRRGLILRDEIHPYNAEPYTGYSITEEGWGYLESHSRPGDLVFAPKQKPKETFDLDDEIPF